MEWCTIRYSRHQFYLHLYSNYDGRELPGLVYDKEFVSVDREDFPEKAPFLLGIAQITPPPPCIQAIWTTFHLKKKKKYQTLRFVWVSSKSFSPMTILEARGGDGSSPFIFARS